MRRQLTAFHVPRDSYVMEGDQRVASFNTPAHADIFVKAVDWKQAGADLKVENGLYLSRVATPMAGLFYVFDGNRHAVAVFKSSEDADLFIEAMKPAEPADGEGLHITEARHLDLLREDIAERLEQAIEDGPDFDDVADWLHAAKAWLHGLSAPCHVAWPSRDVERVVVTSLQDVAPEVL